MSALTKIGVVLLVIASLLLSAGIVTFVNKVEDFQTQAKNAQEAEKKALAMQVDTKALLDAAIQSKIQAVKEVNARVDALNQKIAEKDGKLLELNSQIVRLEQDKKGLEVALATATQAQNGLAATITGLQAGVAELRRVRDTLVDERNQLNVQLTDAIARNQTLEGQLKMAQERNQGLRAQLNEVETKLANLGYTPSTVPQRTTTGTPTLEGVVSTVFNAGGKPWASISIGSKDNVAKDMKFNVINNNEFLGYLTIQQTEPNEAVGVLEGPKVDRVKAGDQVKTQLQ